MHEESGFQVSGTKCRGARWLVEAGFREARIRPSAMTIRIPNIETFVLRHLSALPVAHAVAALSDAKRVALAMQVRAALHTFADGDGVEVPDETNIAMTHSWKDPVSGIH